MLSYLRKNAGSKLVWLIIGAIAFVFIFFGIGGGGGPSSNFKVAGKQISIAEQRRAYDAVLQDSNQSDLDGTEKDKINKARVVAQLINRYLTLAFAESIGLAPSELSVGRVVAQNPSFQADGVFNRSLYEKALKSMRFTPSSYEKLIHDNIAYGRVEGLISMLSPLAPDFANDFIHFSEDIATFDYIFFPASQQMGKLAEPTDKQLEIFYEFNKENWRKPATMKLEYVSVSPEDYIDAVEVTDEDLKSAYEENSADFKVPESAEVSHILISFPSSEPTKEEKAATLAKAEEIYKRSGSEDFAALAKEASDDPNSASNGGSLGTIYKGNNMTVDDKFEDTVFSLPIGKVSKPVESQAGYHIVKVASRLAGYEKSLDEVKDELTTPIKQRKAREMAVAKVESILKFTEKSADLEAAAKSVNLETKITDMFDINNPPAFLLGDKVSLEKAFIAPLGMVAPEITRDDLMVVYKPLERIDAFIPPLAEIKKQVEDAWRLQEAMNLAHSEAISFIKDPNAPKNKKAQVKGSTNAAPRMTSFSKAPFKEIDQQAMLAAVYSVSLPEQTSPTAFSGMLNDEKGYFVLTLKTLEPVDDAIISQPQMQFATLRMEMEKRAMMLQVWYSAYFKQMESEIKVPANLQ